MPRRSARACASTWTPSSAIDRSARLTHGRRRPQAVWLRVAPGIKVDTHPHLVTGTVDSKFGAPIGTGEALAQAREIAKTKGISLVGIHAHLGAQVRDARPYGELARALVAFANEVRAATGAPITELGMGGGVAVRLPPTGGPPSPTAIPPAWTQPARRLGFSRAPRSTSSPAAAPAGQPPLAS